MPTKLRLKPSDPQWDMPVGFSPDGSKTVTLEEMARGQNADMLSLDLLSEDQRAKLAIERIKMNEDYELAVLGQGIVDQKRAIEEIEKGSSVGQLLIELEGRVINNVLERAKKGLGAASITPVTAKTEDRQTSGIITKADLVSLVAEEAGITKKAAQSVIDSIVRSIHDSLSREEGRIRITGLGTFQVARRKARTGFNPQTGAKINIRASNVPKFVPAQSLKNSAK